MILLFLCKITYHNYLVDKYIIINDNLIKLSSLTPAHQLYKVDINLWEPSLP